MKSGWRRRRRRRAGGQAGGQAVDEGLLQGLREWAVGEDGASFGARRLGFVVGDASVVSRGMRCYGYYRCWCWERCVVVRWETKGELSTDGEQ
ncbi:hypothetical protein CGRA01v4_03729 [Colletotrichum graminicola]|nr:hypothetical protein CGRA01v4_03729 [Colletotrichum graminicola]